MEYLIAFAIGIYILYVVIKYIASYPERKRLRKYREDKEKERTIAVSILNGFDIDAENERVRKILMETLPPGYRCGKSRCDGILLKDDKYNLYICDECHNIRRVVRV